MDKEETKMIKIKKTIHKRLKQEALEREITLQELVEQILNKEV